MISKLGLSITLGIGISAGILFKIFQNHDQHRVFINGEVITFNSENQITTALSIRNGIIEATGSDAEILNLVGPETLITDLNGDTISPGFIDAHSHFPASGISKLSVDLMPAPIGNTESIEDIQKALAFESKITDPGDWIIGFGYDDSFLKEGRHPNKTELDEISTSHPIYVWHSSGHMGVANSLGLERLNITEHSKDPEGGIIVRDSDTGKLTGLLKEKAAASIPTLLTDKSWLDYVKALEFATSEYLSQGITTAQNSKANLNIIRAMHWASRLELFPFRIVLFPDSQSLEHLPGDSRDLGPTYNSDKVHIGPIKLVADGSIQGYTAYLSKPYHVQKPALYEQGYRGFPSTDQDQFTKLVSDYHLQGFQLAIHGNGDAAIDNILNAFANAKELGKAQEKAPRLQDDPRMILVHAQAVRPDQLARMKALGVTPSFFSAHTYYWGDIHLNKSLGPERGAGISPAYTAEELGLRYSIHLDSPVAPMNPRVLLWSATNRRSLTNQPVGPEEKISRLSALRAITLDAAWQLFLEDEIGSLEPGKKADLVRLSGSYLDETISIRDQEVVETIIDGETAYLRNQK